MDLRRELQEAIDNNDDYRFRQIVQHHLNDDLLSLAVPQIVALNRGGMTMTLINLGNPDINQFILEEAVYNDNIALVRMLLENNLARPDEDMYDEAVEHDARVADLLARYL